MKHCSIITGLILSILIIFPVKAFAQQAGYWQQSIKYDMNIDMDAQEHRFTGTQRVEYTNNSPETLTRFYYHLYFNAFQPGSMMDVRSRNLPDPDGRVMDRILHLNEDEIGYHNIHWLKQNGESLNFEIQGTVLEVELAEPIEPGETHTFEMEFDSQVPLQVRRSGRDNSEGIDFSMTQWYPKVAEFTHEGWETHPYVAREFIGVWGDFNVKITIDSSYTIGGTGNLQNPNEIGHGYQQPGSKVTRPNSSELTWHFTARNVHDFAWAADPDYVHETCRGPNATTIHLLYTPKTASEHWSTLCEQSVKMMRFMNQQVGTYPYAQYSIIQGGDGGMEYPMATLITGNRSRGSLWGVTAHEMIHSWFQGVVGNNESLYPWMDEGFTTYYTNLTMQYLTQGQGHPHFGSYMSYLGIKYRGLEEPSITHADRFETHYAYGVSSYSKGGVFLHQLSYITGQQAFQEGIKAYYDEWKFHHPTPNDFKRVMEKTSGLELDWYFRWWLHSTDELDYAVKKVVERGDSVQVTLKRKADATMPLDVNVTYTDGTSEMHHIALGVMRGRKTDEGIYEQRIDHPDWNWTSPTYDLTFAKKDEIESIVIDPTQRLAETNRLNNHHKFPLNLKTFRQANTSWNEYMATWRPAAWYGENAGLRLGFTSQGAYLFGDKSLSLDFFWTSGELDDFEADKSDVDYRLQYRQKLDGWGLETYFNLSARRYYGVFAESIGIEKRLGKYGVLGEARHVLSFSAFHHAQTANRFIDVVNNAWERGDVYGLNLRYTLGDPARSGLSANFVAGTHRDLFSASFTEIVANKTFEWNNWFETRFGTSMGVGTDQLPEQFKFNTSTPTAFQEWQNETHTSVINIDDEFTDDVQLIANSGNGLLGYGLSEFSGLDPLADNYLTFTIWNTFRPVKRLPQYKMEFFAGAGRSWEGTFFDDMPLIGSGSDELILASMGVGAVYDVSEIRSINRWISQSRFLQNLALSIRMPFYFNTENGNDEFDPKFIFGVSESF